MCLNGRFRALNTADDDCSVYTLTGFRAKWTYYIMPVKYTRARLRINCARYVFRFVLNYHEDKMYETSFHFVDHVDDRFDEVFI